VGKWKTVLVGVDGSRSSRTALTWAAAEAEDHDADLVVLKAWEPTLPAPMGLGSVPQDVATVTREAAIESLVGVIKEELGETPPIVVQPRVERGNPAHALIEQSAEADLLVVGTRGHGGFAGLLLGSVSQHVAAYAKCPVAVVR